ncbi:MAG: xanthine dehydrogenase family protein molybdopterin-binding subunit [Acidobacteriales bacterium]|nr:xanthine dehydrogenase family protein molybdopterin-binding subunit [Terriglobales bacterium]
MPQDQQNAQAQISSDSVIGKAVSRIDGRMKLTGRAKYGVDYHFDGLVYGVGVASTVANGRVRRIDTAEAEKMPGVIKILHHGNFDPLYRPANQEEEQSRPGESRPPFEDDTVYYYGQFVALVVAQTFEQAQAAASQVHVDYESKPPIVRLEEAAQPVGEPQAKQARGDAEAAYQQAPVKLDATYVTPVETHNPMEMHATIAVWDKGKQKMTLYETSQGIVNHRNVASQVLGMPPESVQVISRFIGSGFGCKLFPWPHSWLAAVASHQLERPVKVSVPRSLMFTTVGHRPLIEQRVRLGATQDGKLLATINEVRQSTSFVDAYLEDCVDPVSMLYSCPAVKGVQHEIQLNTGTPTPMRGPGRTPSLFALESAMDELAIELNMDPIELRLKNYAEKDEGSDKPWSSKHLREAYQMGAERFGWKQRNPQVGSMRKGDEILGWGMATMTWPGHRQECEVNVRLLADGTARAACATQDIGTGTYTVFAEIVSDRTGIPLDRIQVVLGDTSLPPGPTSGGSFTTATVIPAIYQATNKAMEAVCKAAAKHEAFKGVDAKALTMTQGRVHQQDKPASSGLPFQEILQSQRLAALDGQGKSTSGEGGKKYSIHSFGAHFCEVAWDPEVFHLRVTRWLSVVDGGRIINAKTARNQILGAVVMGVGMGLFEETVYDTRTGHPINNNFADYMVPVNTDIPQLECVFLDYPDPVLNEYGARGIGEIGLTGCASALAMATYHATGVRVRKLPIQIEKLMAGAGRKTA